MNVFESMMTGLQEAIDYENGKLDAKKVKITVEPLPEMTADEIKSVRNGTGLTQSIFAKVMGVSVKTVEAWEKGTNQPIGPARRILSIMKNDPQFIKKYHLVNV